MPILRPLHLPGLGTAFALMLACVPALAAPALSLDCGGIGEDESATMRARAPEHALTILFANTRGEYITDVQTRIELPLADQSVEAACGPVGLVDVPSEGDYRLRFQLGEQRREQWLRLKPRGGARITVRLQAD